METSNKSKILIIDDEPSVRETIKFLLKKSDYDVITASNGEEGLAKTCSEFPDLIILDVVMPRMDGLTAGRLIKSYRPLSQVPMIYLTAACNGNDVSQGLKTQAEAYITKPFDIQKLSRLIDEMLGFPMYS